MAGIKVNLKKATWYYKDKDGFKQGPCVFDTLKIMWDFNEVHESTFVFAEGMMDYAAIRDVPPLFKVNDEISQTTSFTTHSFSYTR